MTFKAAYVRHTIDHEVIATSVYGFAALSLIPFIWKLERGKIARYAGSAAVACIMLVALPMSLPLKDIPVIARYPLMLMQNGLVFAQQIGPMLATISGKPIQQEAYEKRMSEIRSKNVLPELKGTVDIYPTMCNVAIAYKMNYKPRPVFQSYLAYRKSLTGLNEEHVQNGKAADTIIVQPMKDLYGYYPMLYDGPSWPVIMSRYQTESCQAAGLVLRRRDAPLKWDLVPLRAHRAKLGDEVEISDMQNKTVFAKINVAITTTGALQKLFFRIFPATLEVRLATGEKKSFVAPTEVMKSGFVLAPFAESPAQVQQLFDAPLSAKGSRNDATTVTSFRVTEQKKDFAWTVFAPDYTFELYEVRFRQ